MGNGKNYAATAGGDKNTCLGRTQLGLPMLLIPASGQMMVRPKVVHIALLNWTSDLFPSLSRAPG
jgi:hypothetical protein